MCTSPVTRVRSPSFGNAAAAHGLQLSKVNLRGGRLCSSHSQTMPRKTASERSMRTISSCSNEPMREPMVSRGTVTILSIMICELC